MKRWIVLSSTALGLAALTACGGGDSSSGNTVPTDADVVVRAVDGIAWNADSYEATAENGEVTIYGVNDSSIAHNLHVKADDGSMIGDFIDLPAKGDDGTITVKLAPGEYRIVCLIAGHQNMDSALVVG